MYRRLTLCAFVALAGGSWLARHSVTGAAERPLEPAGLAADGGVRARPSPDQLIPARVRRLSNAEYDSSVRALLGTSLTPGRDFAPDARQAGFTANEAQRIDTVLALQLGAAAEKLAAESKRSF